MRGRGKETHGAGTVVTDLHQLLVHQLDASQTRRFEQLDLRLDEQVERDLGDEETWARSSRVANSRANVLDRKVVCRVDGLQSVPEDVVEDVVDSCSSAQLLRRDLEGRPIDRGDKVSHELCHELEDEGAPVLFAEEGRVAERVELLLRLTHEGVQSSLHIG